MTERDPAVAALLRESEHFASLSEEARDRLADAATLESVPAGEWLFRAGDVTDACYVIETGSVQVVGEPNAGAEPPVLRVLSRGSVFGELGVLTGAPRSASVRARRDATVARIGAAEFAALLREPEFATALTGRLAAELQVSEAIEREMSGPARLVVIVSAWDGGHTSDLGRRLAELVSRHVRCVAIGPEDDEAHAEDPFELRRGLARRVAEAERGADIVLLDATTGGEAWVAACIRQGDRIVVVTDGAQPEPPRLPLAEGTTVDLVLCGGRPAPAVLHRWRRVLRPRTHWFVAGPPGFDGLEREARCLAGRSVAVVLSGGGARGCAHIGVIDELRRQRVEIDHICGTSAGAYVAAMAAQGIDAAAMRDQTWRWSVEHKVLGDFTVPLVAITRGQRLLAMTANSFGRLRAEELPIRFFATAVDIDTGEEVVLDEGPLDRIVAASMSIPGIVPPVSLDGHELFDGGIIDNIPIRAMRSRADGPVIAVDVSAGFRMHRRPSYIPGLIPPALVRGARRKLTGSAEPLPDIRSMLGRAMLLRGTIASEIRPRSVELAIRPSVADVSLFDWGRIDSAIEAGRAAAREALAQRPELSAG